MGGGVGFECRSGRRESGKHEEGNNERRGLMFSSSDVKKFNSVAQKNIYFYAIILSL